MKIRQCYFNITLPSRYTYLHSTLDKIRMNSNVVTQDLQPVLPDMKVFANKVKSVCEGLDAHIERKLVENTSRENVLIIVDYIAALKTEINLSLNYKCMNIRVLAKLSVYLLRMNFRDMTRENILSFLDSLRKPDVSDPLHKWIGTYNLYCILLTRFFKWLYFREIENNKRPKPSVVENIPQLKRREKSIYKPTDLWSPDDIYCSSLSIVEFQFLGYSDVRGILAEGMAMNEEIKVANLNKAISEVRAIAREWYEKKEYDSICVNIVCQDADIEKASSGAVKGRFINCGQSCIASKRFIVVKKIANEFIEKFVEKTQKLKVGDPLSDDTDIGPLVNFNSLKNMESLVAESVKDGAEILTGGVRLQGKGFFYPPTVLKNVSSSMRIAREEVFGPIAPIIVTDDNKEAIGIANESKYGLGASIWTQDLDKAERMSREIESGIVTVNNVVISDPRVPFGGIKNSGFGREMSRYGMLEFVNIKSVRFYDQLIHNHHVE